MAFSGLRLKAPQLEKFRRPGIVGGFLYGVIFSLGTATAPLLVVLAAAAAQSDPAQGVALGFAFGVGRALPFLLIGLSAGFVSRFLQSPGRRKALQAVSGSVLLFASLYFGRVFLSFL
ncbi:MAG: cytochrome c biogenesis protein CcdA [Verrucomicrobiales bacterium]